MSYEEFWEKDHLLVESYVKKHDMELEGETQSNWELAIYVRNAIQEALWIVHGDKKKPKERVEFPKKPSSRGVYSSLNEKRNNKIAKEIQQYFNDKLRRRKAESDDND